MESKNFSVVLQSAIAGDKDAIMAILSRYLPLFNKQSMIGEILSEDLRQYIILRVIEQLPKFDPDNAK